MRRYDAREITEHHYQALRLLLTLNQAKAHIVVRSKRVWPPPFPYSPRQQETQISGDAIN